MRTKCKCSHMESKVVDAKPQKGMKGKGQDLGKRCNGYDMLYKGAVYDFLF